MQLVQVTPFRPVMLSIARKFGKTDIGKTLRMLLFWSVRFLIAGGARSGGVETAFGNAAKGISDGHIRTTEQLADQLKDVVPVDAAFENAFATASVAKADIARYYLRALELKLQNNPEPEWIPNENVVINLEHILPINPDASWTAFDNTRAVAFYRRLGNMVLLRASTNSQIGNQSFSVKRQTYGNSTFMLTKEVAQNTAWEPKDIEERQRRLAKIAVEVWPARVQ